MEYIKRKYTRKFQTELMTTNNIIQVVIIWIHFSIIGCSTFNHTSTIDSKHTYWKKGVGLTNATNKIRDSIEHHHGVENLSILSYHSHEDGQFMIFWIQDEKPLIKSYQYKENVDSLWIRTNLRFKRSHYRWVENLFKEGNLSKISGPCEERLSESFGIEIELIQGPNVETVEFTSDCLSDIYRHKRKYKKIIHLIRIKKYEYRSGI